MKKIKIYFYKHGFQTDGVSLWVVQQGSKKWLTKRVYSTRYFETKFSTKNPHAYIQTLIKLDSPQWFGKEWPEYDGMKVYSEIHL